MNNFEVLNHYTIPSDILMDMLSTYKLLGMNDEYKNRLENQYKFIREDVLQKDTFFLSNIIGVDITENRMRLLITKNSIPKSKEEHTVIGIKKAISSIFNNGINNVDFNGSDILDLLNLIYGKQTIKFSQGILDSRMSVRLTFEKMLETYKSFKNEKKFEKISLAVICFMEIINLKPFTKYNEIGAILALYYMLLTSEVYSFKYVSFFEFYQKFKTKIDNSVAKGSINYTDNYLKTSDTLRLVFEIIRSSYFELNKLVESFSVLEHAFKSDVIEETILRKMPTYFTKDDVRRIHPDASDSTINRILFKLRDEQIILPLGKGRSARWMRIISDNDPRLLFGLDYENKD